MESLSHKKTVERWLWTLKRAATRLAYRAFPALSAVSLEMAAGKLTSAAIPQLFSRNLRQIDPSLNDELLDLYGGSQQVLSNHFGFLNRSHQFQPVVDWQFPESLAWRSELHAFDYGLNLALTFRISGEERYARHLRHLIAHWIAENPPFRKPGWLTNPLARRVRNWILAADLARADWERDQEFLDVVRQSLALQCAALIRHMDSACLAPPSLEQVRGLLLAGTFFDKTGGAELRTAALERTLRALESRFHAQPGFLPPRPAFQLSLAAAVLECLLFKAGEGEKERLKEGLREILANLEGILLPDGNLPLFGLPATDDFADVGALAAVILQDPKWKTLAEKFGLMPYMLLGEKGKTCFAQLPEKVWQADSRLQPQSALYRLSGRDSSALVVNGQVDSSPGAHADYLSFELSMQGQRVIVDSGAYTPEGELEEKYFSTALAHNLFLIDHQTPQAAAAVPADALPQEWESGSGFTGLRWPEQRLVSGVKYRRAWYCLEGRGWVILESLEGQRCDSGTSLLHFYPIFEIQLLSNRAIARSRVFVFTVIPFGAPRAQMRHSRGDDAEFPGWYAPAYAIRYPASVLACRWTNLELPWVGGQIITPGDEASFFAGAPDIRAGTISFELSGKRYRLPLPSRTPELAPEEREPAPLASLPLSRFLGLRRGRHR